MSYPPPQDFSVPGPSWTTQMSINSEGIPIDYIYPIPGIVSNAIHQPPQLPWPAGYLPPSPMYSSPITAPSEIPYYSGNPPLVESLSESIQGSIQQPTLSHNDLYSQYYIKNDFNMAYLSGKLNVNKDSDIRHRYRDKSRSRSHSPRRKHRNHHRPSSRDRESRYRYESSRRAEHRSSHRHRSPSSHNRSRSPLHHRHRSPSTRDRYRSHSHQSSQREHSSHRDHRSSSRVSSHRSSSRASSHSSRRSKGESLEKKPMTDREKLLETFRKNYCSTSEDLYEKMDKWNEEQKKEAQELSKMWYRSSPADLYYEQIEDSKNVKKTEKLEALCDMFREELINRGKRARPEVDELPPLKMPAQTCKHSDDNDSSSSSSSSLSSDEDNYFDEDGLEGYNERIMMELQRKINHPRRLHPEMWFNEAGEMNGGPLCRCSARARKFGIRHGVFVGEEEFPKCLPSQNNVETLYHYRITVSPPTNFLIKAPTIISYDEHEFLFSGFSMFSHKPLKKLPTCKVIRFNIEYSILYEEEPSPINFTIEELNLFEEFMFSELLELVDLDLGKGTETSCSQFHFMPRFIRMLPEGGYEILSMCHIMRYLLDQNALLIDPEKLKEYHNMDQHSWQNYVDTIKGMIVTYPGKKPCSVRVDQLDRTIPAEKKDKIIDKESFYPEIVHFGIRPPQLSYAGNPEYQKAWRYYVKYRHLLANMATKPTPEEKQKLAAKQDRLQEMRLKSKMKRDVTVAISSEGFYVTGLMCDVVQHAMLIPVLIRHLRFHNSLVKLEERIGYTFEQSSLLQTALTHPSYRDNFGTNPDHARNSLTNCGIRQPQYGDRRIHYTRKKGIVTLINIMSRLGTNRESESTMKHNERLEFLGDAVVEFLSSIHLFKMFSGLAEGGLATYRAAIVQNQHLALLAKNLGLDDYMLYSHGSDLCRDVVMRHAMANCFEALMGALYLDGGVEVADRVFALALWHKDKDLLEVWNKEREHPLQEQEPLGDRKYIKDFEFLQKLTQFEDSIGVQFKHIRLLARAFTDRSVGFTHLTLGSNQRLEFLGDTVLQLVVTARLYKHFPEHHEGHLSLLRSSLVNHRTQATVCDDLNMSEYAVYNNPKTKPSTKKHKADLLESFIGALFIDKNLDYCQAFCEACFFPRLREFIINRDWNDPKSKLQQCCLTLRSMEGGEPDIPLYKVIKCRGPTNTRVYTVAVYFRGTRLAAAKGHSIQDAEMNAAREALETASELFPQFDNHKRAVVVGVDKHKSQTEIKRARYERLKMRKENTPKAYRGEQSDSSDDSITKYSDDDDDVNDNDKINESDSDDDDDDSGLDSDTELNDKLKNIQVSSLVSDMEKLRDELIKNNQYEKLKNKYLSIDSDDD